MDYTILNPEGNYDNWSEDKLKELRQKSFGDNFGKLLCENELIRVWELHIPPYGRIPFKKRSLDYTITCLNDGLVIARNGNGRITLFRLEEGDVTNWNFREAPAVLDLENIGANTLKAIVTEYKELKEVLGGLCLDNEK